MKIVSSKLTAVHESIILCIRSYPLRNSSLLADNGAILSQEEDYMEKDGGGGEEFLSFSSVLLVQSTLQAWSMSPPLLLDFYYRKFLSDRFF